eukprot:gene672-985_t
MSGFGSDISGLMDILKVDAEEQERANMPPGMTMGRDGKKEIAPPNMKVAIKQPAKQKQEAIWDDKEFKAGGGVVMQKTDADDRPEPKYDIKFMQGVGSQDVFFNMNDRDISSDHCEGLLVTMELPGCKLKDIDLDILKDRLLLQSPKFRLNLVLPHPVDKAAGKAKWDKDKEQLRVELVIMRNVQYIKNLDDVFEKN